VGRARAETAAAAEAGRRDARECRRLLPRKQGGQDAREQEQRLSRRTAGEREIVTTAAVEQAVRRDARKWRRGSHGGWLARCARVAAAWSEPLQTHRRGEEMENYWLERGERRTVENYWKEVWSVGGRVDGE
jgi:hypothetical protein